MKIRVLSLFDGISCARVGIERAGFQISKYYASEIESNAIVIALKNYPDSIQVGDIKNIQGKGFYNIFLLIGGSPCQDLSIAKNNRKGLNGDRSGLFWEYVRVKDEVKPKYFIFENVNSMPKTDKEIITKTLGVEPIMINAASVSAQNRKRLFWTNIPGITQPEDKGILLKDILEYGEVFNFKSYTIDANYFKRANSGSNGGKSSVEKHKRQMVRIGHYGNGGQAQRVYSVDGKSVNISANGGGAGANTGLYLVQRPRGFNKGGKYFDKAPTVTSKSYMDNCKVGMKLVGNVNPSGKGISGQVYSCEGKSPTILVNKGEGHKIYTDEIVRKLTPIEVERLFGLPDDYTKGVSNTNRYKVLGNGFNADVIKHIVSFIKE